MTSDPAKRKKTRLGVLISGRGSNMLALSQAVSDGRLQDAEIAVVISDQVSAPGLVLAQAGGLETRVIARRGRTREEHDAETVSCLQERSVDLVCLAGYMRLLSRSFIAAFPNRIINIHPSLLPAFPGLHAQCQALEHGVKWSGCTVHFVDDTLDGGPIIAQAIVPVLDHDSEETLAARILAEEHRLYVEAMALVISGNYEVVGRRVLRKNHPDQ